MPTPNSLFRKVLLAGLLLALGTVVSLEVAISGYLEDRERTRFEEMLSVRAELLAADLAAQEEPALSGWTGRVAAASRSRVVVLDPSGRVLADSGGDPLPAGYASRPEIREALNASRGDPRRSDAVPFSRVPSASVRSEDGADLYSLAVPVEPGSSRAAVLVLTIRDDSLRQAMTAIRGRRILVSLAVLAAALALSYAFAFRFSRRVQRLQSFAEAMLNRKVEAPLPAESLDELGALGNALNRLAERLGGYMQALDEEARIRDTILASMVEGVLAIDHGMHVTFCNASFARLAGTGYPVEGQPPLVTLLRDPALHDILSRVIENGEPVRERILIRTPDLGAFQVHARPFGPPGQPGALAVLHDINELERLERVRKDFVTNVSHELRTPLSVIQGYSETLLEGGLDDRESARRFLDLIQSNAIRLNHITEDLLALSALESGDAGAPPPAETISLNAAVESAHRIVAPIARACKVTVNPPELPPENAWITGSPLRLEQVLINLLTNAIKFNREGGHVETLVRSLADGTAEIRISDDGPGIPSEDLPRIFERFYRVDRVRSRKVGGTGLGLAIVKHAVETMGGRVEVQSELGRGSSFSVFLPATPSKSSH